MSTIIPDVPSPAEISESLTALVDALAYFRRHLGVPDIAEFVVNQLEEWLEEYDLAQEDSEEDSEDDLSPPFKKVKMHE